MADGDSLLGFPNFGPSDASYGGLLNPAQQRQVALQQIIGILGAAGAAGQSSRLPIPLGMALGRGALEGQEAGNSAARQFGQMSLLAPEIQLKRLQAARMMQGYDYLQRYMDQQGQQQPGAFPPAPPPASGMPGQQFPAALAPPAQTGDAISNPYEAMTRQAESSSNPDARNPASGSTSSGLYGFTDGTLQTTLKNHPELANIPDPKNDPRVLAALRQDNAQTFFKNNGRFPTPQEERQMHVNGPNAGVVRVASNGPVPIGGGGGSAAAPQAIGGSPAMGGPPIPNDPVAASLLSDFIGPTYGKIAEKQFPGPTDFARAFQDYQNAPPEAKQLAFQRLQNAAGDRYQISRQGWMLDKQTQQWTHLPELGVGVTGEFNPATGQTSARVVPGAAGAETTMATARAKGPATFETTEIHGPFGNSFLVPRADVPDILSQNGVPRIALPPGMSVGGALPSGRTAVQIQSGPQVAQPQVPSTGARGTPVSSVPIPVQTPGGTKDITQLSLDDLFPGGQGIPMPPAPPRGAGYGKPNEATTARQKSDNDLVEGYTKEAAENQGLYQSIAHVRDIVQGGFNSNETAPFFTKLMNIAQGMGMTDIVDHFKSSDPNDAAAFQKASTLMVFALVKKFQGQVRVAEITGSQKASPDITIPPAANLSILSDMLAMGKVQDVRAPLAQRYITETGGAPLSAFNEAFNKAAPLDTVTSQLRQHLRESGGWLFPGDPGTPSGGPAAPYTKLKTPPSDEDIANTAMKYKIPVEEVKRRLGMPQ